MNTTVQAKFAEYTLTSSISAKEAMLSYLQFLIRKGELSHEGLVFLRNEIDRLTSEIEALNRQLGNASKPTISVHA